MNKTFYTIMFLFSSFVTGIAAYPVFSGGADFRIRQEAFDNIPVYTESPSVTRGGNNNYFRFRTRVWVGTSFGDLLSVDARLVNEMRSYISGNPSWEWPDEIIADKISISLKGLFDDRLSMTLGRQDIYLGSGRLVCDGTPKDGSRSSYFDGVSGKVIFSDRISIDFFGVYTTAENKTAIGHMHRDIVGYDSAFNGLDEAGTGIFLTHTDSSAAHSESLYYIWKHETSWISKKDTKIPEEDLHVAGALFKGTLNNTKLEAEFALEFSPDSESDRRAIMTFISAVQSLNSALKPFFGANFLYLSGDDPNTDRDESWNAAFGRAPWVSELLLYAFDPEGAGAWNNLIYGYITAGIKPSNKVKLTLSAGFAGADEANGAGGGSDRGMLYTGRADFKLRDGDSTGAGKIFTHLQAEILSPGDYYVSDDTAYFLRWHIDITL